MKIAHIEKEKQGKFLALKQGIEVGELDYSWVDKDRFSITHTAVLPDERGQGIARDLVEAAAEFARENKYRIIPMCSYAAKVLGDGNHKDIL